MNPEAGKSIAAAFALAGFTVAIVSGLGAGNPVVRVLQGAIIAMVLCYLAGLVIGAVALRAAAEHVERYKAANPVGGAEPGPGKEPQTRGAGAP
ncbi:MAG: hypothetical protein WD749_14070 [Phycisphaerales bacterium]